MTKREGYYWRAEAIIQWFLMCNLTAWWLQTDCSAGRSFHPFNPLKWDWVIAYWEHFQWRYCNVIPTSVRWKRLTKWSILVNVTSPPIKTTKQKFLNWLYLFRAVWSLVLKASTLDSPDWINRTEGGPLGQAIHTSLILDQRPALSLFIINHHTNVLLEEEHVRLKVNLCS